MRASDRPSRWGKAAAAVGVMLRRPLLLALTGLATLAAAAPAAERAPLPSAWLRFAEQSSQQVERWLADKDDGALQRLHADLAARAEQRGEHGAALVLRMWIDANGHIAQIRVAAADSAALDGQLEAALQRHKLAAPPADMPQPLVLQLDLRPPP